MINGVSFEISQPYAEGHACTAAEAKALNQTRAENIGNNLRAKLKEMAEADSGEADMQAVVAAFDAEYVFTLTRVSAARKLDPVEREAIKIAKELLKAHLAESGRKLTVAPEGLSEEDWEEKIEAELDRLSNLEAVVKEAKKNVAAKSKQAETLLSAVGGVSV
jgi:hypothetical protein